ncbi:MAG: hypothetical protein K2H39_07265 [Paramuribaculum sp.]|nr:hypothetical protein [Paramuribaculum sp.]
MKQLNQYTVLLLAILFAACSGKPKNVVMADREPSLYPQVAAATFPVNIAAPTFMIDEQGEKFYTEIGKVGVSRR